MKGRLNTQAHAPSGIEDRNVVADANVAQLLRCSKLLLDGLVDKELRALRIILELLHNRDVSDGAATTE